MSSNLSPAAKLTALVLAAPKLKPYDDSQDLRPYCALRRASVAMHGVGHGAALVDVAAELGFTPDGAVGIMNGWDRAEGTLPPFTEQDSNEYLAGEQLGERLHALVHSS